ncbi:MAG: hypothetical protein QNI86_13490 [Halieaceae bacterium]|nr:hypothetical protein [Halieaceae bacterium]
MKSFIGLVLLVALAVGGFFANEARKEIKYLCGNFVLGVSDQSVLSQLSTGDFLRYSIYASPEGSRIIVDSLLTAGLYRCVVDFDAGGKVINASVGF